LNLKFPKYFWDENKDKIVKTLQIYFSMGGGQLQVNVLDAQTLKDAVNNPDAHSNLIVRVGGFSAYFVELGKEIQLEIISRTEIGS
jgi:formate C-acetyltransferase